MKKIITTIMLLVTVAMGAWADELIVAGKSLTIGKAATLDNSNNNNIKKGSVTYDGDKTLTLDGVSIQRSGDNNRGLLSSLSGLKVVLSGTNYITTTNAAGIRFSANATIEGKGSLSISSGETAIYIDSNTTLTIQGSASLKATTTGEEGVYVNKKSTLIVQGSASLTAKGKYGFNANSHKNSETLIFQGNAVVTTEQCSDYAIYGFQQLTVGGNAKVTLTGNGSKATIKNLAGFTTKDGIAITDPSGGVYNENSLSVVTKTSTSPYTGTILIEKPILINSTNFPDANFRSYLTSQDYGKDGMIGSSELPNVTTILVPNMRISKLNGIELFTALTTLDCSANKLTTLDLSKNTELTDLNCRSNSIEVLRFYNDTKLTKLDCSSNKLKSLDVSDYWSLTKLDCSKNSIEDLQVSWNSYLTELKCSENDLKKLNVSKNAKLTTLVCNKNNLDELDVSTNTKLTELNCGNNNLKVLDVSKNINLTKLDCSENQLSALDVSNNTKLTTLWCYYNQIGGVRMVGLVRSLPTVKGGKLYVIDTNGAKERNVCSKNQVAAAKAKGWTVYNYKWGDSETYAGSDPVTILINEANFPDANFRAYLLNRDYGKDGQLTDEDLADATVMDVSKRNIASLKGIEYFVLLRILECTGNELTTIDVSKNTELEKFSCAFNKLTALSVSQNTRLNLLFCNNNQLTYLDVANNKELTSLRCYRNKIRISGMETLVKSLPKVTAGDFYPIDCSSADEMNVCKKTQVATAKGKGWKVYNYNKGNGVEYAGSDPVTIAIDKKNFPDDNFRAWLLEQSYGKDAELTETEIDNVKEISLIVRHIESLEGLEFFTALTKLNCSSNDLKTLDVSKLADLSVLNCYSNKLETLDVSKNIHLSELNCSWNRLETINVSKNTELLEINCYNNRLSTLDLSGTVKLSRLICYLNQLETLDVSKNPALKSLDCSRNGLKTIDVSKNTKLEDLDCRNNQLETLDVSKNVALKELDCGANQLSALNVSKNTSLYNLWCYNNQIKDTQMDALVESLVTGLRNNLYVVDCRSDNEQNVCTITQVAKANEKGWTVYDYNNGSPRMYEGFDTEAIVIDETNFPDGNFRAWLLTQDYGKDGRILQKEIAGIAKINVAGNEIESLKGIEFFTALTELNCSSNKLETLDVSKNTALTTLECAANQLETLDVSKNTALTKLYCGSNGMKTLDVSKNTALTVLECSKNPLETLDVSKNTALTTLYCSSNGLETLDVSKNINLTSLSCGSNRLETLDVSKNTNLLMLQCEKNQLTSLMLTKDNAKLFLIYIFGNQIKDEHMDELVNSLPTVTMGALYVFDTSDSEEQNVCTTGQVAIAKDKGWTVFYYDADQKEYLEYEGSSSQEIVVRSALVAGFSSLKALDFTGSDLSAWTATGFRNGNVMLSRVYKVPAGTGVYLKASEAGTFTVPSTTRRAYYANFFVGTPEGLTVEPTETVGGETYQTLSFAMSKSTGNPGFFPNTDDKTYAEGKMYLHLPVWALGDAARLNDKIEMINDNRGGVTDTADEGLVTVTVSEVGAAGFSSDKNLDFTGITGISAWIATGFAEGNVLLSRVYAVPAGTGVYLKADNPGTAITRNIPVTTERPCYANLFVGTGGTAVTVEPTQVIDNVTYRTLSFAKSKTTGKPGFFPNTEDKAYAAGKMYLQLPASFVDVGREARQMASEDAPNESRTFGLVFCEDDVLSMADMATGIGSVKHLMDNDNDDRGVYDLQGRRLQNRKPMNKKSFIISGGRVHY